MLNPQPRTSPIYKSVANLIETKNAKVLTDTFSKWGKENPKGQLVLALTVQKVADDLNGINHYGSLADDIILDQCRKFEQWGDNLFPLTKNQIGVIVRDVI